MAETIPRNMVQFTKFSSITHIFFNVQRDIASSLAEAFLLHFPIELYTMRSISIVLMP